MATICRTNSSDSAFIAVVKKLDKELAIHNGEQNDFYSQFNGIEALQNCVIAVDNDIPIGSGAFKPFDEDSVEIKRMYVEGCHRGKGISKLILSELEAWAKEKGYRRCVLETGTFLTAAVELYRSQGYTTIPRYEPYTDVETSVCFEKVL